MSSLTGEPRPVPMQVEAADRDSVIESKNIAFSSALVIDGQAVGVVTRVADRTYIGTIAGLASGQPTGKTTMYLEVQAFVKAIGIMAVTMAAILAIVGFSRRQRWQDVLINAFISVVVANVPQGLPATVTSMLSLASSSLAEKNVYVKRTEIIESLGSASVICSDKTGTLTMNLMSVDAIWMDGNLDWLRDRKFGGEVPSSASKGGVGGGGSMRALQFGGGSMKALNSGGSLRNIAIAPTAESKPSATGSSKAVATGDVAISVGSSAPGVGSFRRLKATYQIQRTTQELPYVDLMLIAAVNNSAKYDATDRSAVIGDASEAALLRFCDRFGVTDFFRQSYSVVFTVPFSSSTKFSAVVCEHPSFPDQHIILLKGAPEIVLEKCTTYMHHAETMPLDDRFRSEQKRAYEKMAGEGQRVLGFIRQIVPARDPSDYDIETFPKTGYQFVGMTGLTDPPKPGVPECILKLHGAGIRVFMVTGDHPFTAEAIGRQVNLITGPTVKDVAEDRGCDQADIDMLADDEVRSIVLPGSDIKDLTEDEWNRILAKPEIVFARTTPQQKLEIVKHCQRLGHLVAVTGDGVNDAPALKQANIGVSMGKNASDVAREAAAIILMDDNFPSIIHAIEAGRLIFDNLKKTVAYTLTHLWPEVVPVILALLFGLPIIVLTIDLGTELGPAISLSKEAMEADVMTRPPRDLKKDRLLSRALMFYSYVLVGLMESAAGLIAYILVFRHYNLQLTDISFTNQDNWTFGNENTFHRYGRVFTAADQDRILKELNATVFFNIVLCQFWHIWFVRARIESFFDRSPLRNPSMNYGVLLSLAIMVIVIWVPGCNDFFQASPPPAIGLVPNLVFCLVLLAVTEFAKYSRRVHSPATCSLLKW